MTSTNAHDVVPERPGLTGVPLATPQAVDTADAAAVAEQAVGVPARDRRVQTSTW